MLSNWDSRGPNREHWWSRSREYGTAETLQGRFYDVISGILTRSHCVSLGYLEPSTLRLRGRWFSVTQSCSGSERGEARRKSCHFNSVSRETKGVLCLAEELQPSGPHFLTCPALLSGQVLSACVHFSHSWGNLYHRTNCLSKPHSYLRSQYYCFVTILL